MTGDMTEQVAPQDQCFICLNKLRDGRPTVTVGLGFEVHKECNEDDDDC